ncbi:MAG: LysE family transporter [Syntrophomonadaceae bacterium]|nr:LysE family transporter [Syntrophomonadaceae bacterium]
MDNGALFVTAFVVGLSGAMMPGPLLTTAIAESMRRGFRAGPQIVLGHAILELALVLALLGGLASFLVRSEVTRVISYLGGAFLIFMAGTMLLDTLRGRISLDDSIRASESRKIRIHPVVAGITVSLANPYWHLWWATVGLSYISMAIQSGTAGLVSFYSGHIASDLGWYSAVSLAVSSGRKFINQTVYNFILTACGIFLLALGVYFIYTGFSF